jgi:hypothetical protein
MAQITITGLEQLTKKLKTVSEIANAMEPPMNQALSHLHRRVGRTVRKAPGAFAAMATDAQRRAYWARVKSGKINHGKNGYERTNNIQRSWTTQVKRTSTHITGTLGNNAPGAIYVHDWQPNFIKASKWPNVNEVVEKEGKAVQGYFDAAIGRIVNS